MTIDGIKHLDPYLTFLGSGSDIQTGINTKVLEYKSAWMVIDEHHPRSNDFVVPARIPHYVANGIIVFGTKGFLGDRLPFSDIL